MYAFKISFWVVIVINMRMFARLDPTMFAYGINMVQRLLNSIQAWFSTVIQQQFNNCSHDLWTRSNIS